jgi:hypothetical protein
MLTLGSYFFFQDPLCKAGDRIYNSTEKTQAWRKTLHDGNLVVVLYNAHNFKTQDVSVSWNQVRLGICFEGRRYLQ